VQPGRLSSLQCDQAVTQFSNLSKIRNQQSSNQTIA
jgi:hypothetical protein